MASHRRECPAITYMAMGFRPRSFPVGGMYVKGIGRLTKVKKITRFSFPLLLNPFACALSMWKKCTFDKFLLTGRNFFVMQNCK